MPDEGRADAETARQRLKAAGASGAVMMRVVGKDQQINYTPGTAMPAYYGGFGPYWGYGWGTAYSPGYLTTDTILSVETLVYSLNDDKLIWASKSDTVSPTSMNDLVNSLVDATVAEMKKQKVL